MVSESELKSIGPRSFPGREEYEFAFKFQCCKTLLKNQCGERDLMFLFWSALIVGGRWVRLGSWERWKGGKVGKVRKVGGWGS